MADLPKGFILQSDLDNQQELPIQPQAQAVPQQNQMRVDAPLPQQSNQNIPKGYVSDAMPPQQPQESTYPERLSKQWDKRQSEVADTFTDYAKGDIGLGSALLQTVGKGGFAATGDIIAETVGSVAGLTPEAIKDPIKRFAGEMLGYALDTDTAKLVADEWNSLDETTQKNLESSGAIMSFLLPKVKLKGVGKSVKGFGDAIKKERLAKTLKLPDTPANRVAEAGRLFKDPIDFNEMVDVASKVKGVTSGNAPKKNILALGNQIDLDDKKMLMRLRTLPRKVDVNLIDDTVDLHLSKLIEENSWLQSDSAISSAFDNNIKVMHQILDRHPKTPEGIILARRAFDKKLKKAALSAKAPEAEATARDAVSRVLRRALNDIVHKADPTANTDKILRSQSMMYRAMENLTESYKTYDTTGGAVLELAKRHPMATAMAVGGTGTLGGLLTPTILGGAVVGAGAYGAYKGLPNALSGVGRGLGALGALSDPARVPILRSAAIYGNREEDNPQGQQ